MTLMGVCGRCKEEKPIHVPNERRRLTRGPDGEHLCRRHAREAWEEHDDVEYATVSTDSSPELVDTRKADSRGRVNLGTEYADKNVRVAVYEVVDDE